MVESKEMQAAWALSKEAQRSPDLLPHKLIYRKAVCRFDERTAADKYEALDKAVPAVMKFWADKNWHVVHWHICTFEDKLIEIEGLLLEVDG
jgi:methionine synthase II (cobalamin-independent)